MPWAECGKVEPWRLDRGRCYSPVVDASAPHMRGDCLHPGRALAANPFYLYCVHPLDYEIRQWKTYLCRLFIGALGILQLRPRIHASFP